MKVSPVLGAVVAVGVTGTVLLLASPFPAHAGTDHVATAPAPAGQPTPPQPTAPQPSGPPLAEITPLRTLAQALGEQGQGRFRSIYTSITINQTAHQVELYLTAPDQGAALVAAARTAHPDLDASLVRVHQSKYTQAYLVPRIDKLMRSAVARQAGVMVAYPARNGSGIVAMSTDPRCSSSATASTRTAFTHTTEQVLRAELGVPVTLIHGNAPKPL